MMEDNNIFKCIRFINETNIEYKKKNKKDYIIDTRIQEILKDEDIFLKISKEKAYKILSALKITNIDEVYKSLITKDK